MLEACSRSWEELRAEWNGMAKAGLRLRVCCFAQLWELQKIVVYMVDERRKDLGIFAMVNGVVASWESESEVRDRGIVWKVAAEMQGHDNDSYT